MQHSLVCRGLHAAGCNGISHGTAVRIGWGSSGQDCLASGVVLTARAAYVVNWQQVDRDADGRGLAANIETKQGRIIRVVGVYGVTGASLPGFEGQHDRVEAERRLIEFVRSQARLADENGWLMVLIGDLNSVADVNQDSWRGTRVCREACLASTLLRVDMVGTHRARHPRLRAFGYCTRSGTASRLVGI